MKMGLCVNCRHLHPSAAPRLGWTCDAFPGGVPLEIALGEVVHDKPYPGDNGILYEEAPAARPQPKRTSAPSAG